MTATDLYQKYGVSSHSDPAGQIDAILTQKEQQIAACDILKTQKASIEAGLADIAAKQAEFARRDEEIGELTQAVKERDAALRLAATTVSNQESQINTAKEVESALRQQIDTATRGLETSVEEITKLGMTGQELQANLAAVTAERNALAALKAEFDAKVRAAVASGDPETILAVGSEYLKPEEKRRAAALDEKIAALQAERAEIPV